MSSSPRRRRIRLTPARAARVGTVVIAALLVSAAVAERSSSAFTASTEDQPGRWTAGQMTLTANGPTEMSLLNMVPGESTTECVDVTYSGTVPSAKLTEVKLRRGANAVAGDLAQYLDFTVTRGPSCADMAGAATVASGKLSGLDAASTFATGYATGWTPSGDNDKRGFAITVTLPASIENEGQGKEATASFAWEVQSTPSTP